MRRLFNYNFVGASFGVYTVVAEVEPKHYNGVKSPQYKCVCSICNIESIKSRRTLTNGVIDKCTCSRSKSSRKKYPKDLTGTVVNNIKVLSREVDIKDSNGYFRQVYKCQCSCGRIRAISRKHLLQSKSNNCNCSNRNYSGDMMPMRPTTIHPVDLTGMKVGLLSVVKMLTPTSYQCICECGCTVAVDRKHLVSKAPTSSCGCHRQSILEYNTRTVLDSHGVNYVTEYTFDDLRGLSDTRHLRFDFMVFDKFGTMCLIECQGRQHYEQNDYLDRTSTLHIHDTMKYDYACLNNIKLIYISYKDNNINSIRDHLTNNNII